MAFSAMKRRTIRGLGPIESYSFMARSPPSIVSARCFEQTIGSAVKWPRAELGPVKLVERGPPFISKGARPIPKISVRPGAGNDLARYESYQMVNLLGRFDHERPRSRTNKR